MPIVDQTYEVSLREGTIRVRGKRAGTKVKLEYFQVRNKTLTPWYECPYLTDCEWLQVITMIEVLLRLDASDGS